MAGVYIFKYHLDFSWIWAIILGFFSGFVVAALLIAVPISIIDSIVEAKTSSLNQKINEIDIHLKKNVIEAVLTFKKPQEEGYLSIPIQLQYIPSGGDKFYITDIAKEASLSNVWTTGDVYEKILKLRPDVFDYKWHVEEIIWKPFYKKNFVIVVLH